MQKLVSTTQALDDTWSFIQDDQEIPATGSILVSAELWGSNKESLKARGDIGLVVVGDTDLDALKDELTSFSVIAINFPAFTDGRGYSQARLLKERYHYTGELRAFGDVLLDQLFFMKRCGFDTFLLKDGLSSEKALEYFLTFSNPYQLAYDLKTPLFRRKA